MLNLPTHGGRIEAYKPIGVPLVPRAPVVPFTRVAFAAAHVISDPIRERDPGCARPAIDWGQTLAFREALWDQGLDLAEAMDTAQRGMGIDWKIAKELIGRTLSAARAHSRKPRVACGAGTDHQAPGTLKTLDAIAEAYETQMEVIEKAGGQIILMASRAFPAIGATIDTYHSVYRRLIDGAQEPVILHWLGEMFDPELVGYWGTSNVDEACDFLVDLIAHNSAKVDGIKISLFDQALEESVRERLPDGVRLYTGDDFNYTELIAGSGQSFSHALLGIFAGIAPAASQALEALAQDDPDTYHALLEPTIPLSREIFRDPTRFYKAGIAFLAWLNGLQTHFIMPAGLQSSRGIVHYSKVFRLADKANLLTSPELAVRRMRVLLELHGIA